MKSKYSDIAFHVYASETPREDDGLNVCNFEAIIISVWWLHLTSSADAAKTGGKGAGQSHSRKDSNQNDGRFTS